jgi:DNA-binding MarR family transcriptional regulator/N-acetylglutamate synthase-like GNAT family acetyltransferase
MAEAEFRERVEAVRRFNRFYTKRIGVLHEGLLGSSFSLTEVRVLYELAHRHPATATELRRELGLDAGYLSRILRGFHKKGLMAKAQSETDGRQSLLSLTEAGKEAFAPLNAGAHEEIAGILGGLSETHQKRVLEAMGTIQAVMGDEIQKEETFLLRPPQPGDMGWVVHRHGVLYGQEYQWDEQFEALVASIVAQFIRNYDPKRERCWIAERNGEIEGSVFLMRQSKTVAKLRLLLVEPRARGMGVGSRLVGECVRFARQAGYRKLVLWTNSVLHSARRIYERAGFRLVNEEPHHSFGHDLVAQTWELKL